MDRGMGMGRGRGIWCGDAAVWGGVWAELRVEAGVWVEVNCQRDADAPTVGDQWVCRLGIGMGRGMRVWAWG